MSNKQKGIIALLLLIFSVFGGGLDLSNILPQPKPPHAAILTIEKPSQEVLDRVEIFSKIITNPDDRAKLSKKERDKRAKKKRKEDPNPNRRGKAKNVSQKSKRKKK